MQSNLPGFVEHKKTTETEEIHFKETKLQTYLIIPSYPLKSKFSVNLALPCSKELDTSTSLCSHRTLYLSYTHTQRERENLQYLS